MRLTLPARGTMFHWLRAENVLRHLPNTALPSWEKGNLRDRPEWRLLNLFRMPVQAKSHPAVGSLS